MRQDVVFFMRKMRETANLLAQAYKNMDELRQVYTDRGYAPGQPNEITAADLGELAQASEGKVITSADLSNFVILAVQLLNFMSNKAVIAGNYNATVNQFRNDV